MVQQDRSIKSLPEDILHRITLMVSTGESSGKEIAEWLHAQGYLTQVSVASLRRAVSRWKNRLSPEVFIPQEIVRTYLDEQVAEIDDQVDELVELTRLYHLQMRRIATEFMLESEKLLPKTVKEIDAAARILLKLAELKMRLGVYETVPDRVMKRVQIEDSRNTQKLLLDKLLTERAADIIEGEVTIPQAVKGVIRQGLLKAPAGASRGGRDSGWGDDDGEG